LARHVAHLFIRDPLVMFSERIAVDDTTHTDHFESIQSTNWRSVRWKPPPPEAREMGWRVELRTMEAQVTDFENAAFTVFVVLLTRTLLSLDLNLYMPLSRVEDNYARARKREAAHKERFWFRKNIVPAAIAAAAAASASASTTAPIASTTPSEAAVVDEMSLADIVLGQATPGGFPGLVPLIFAYLDVIHCDPATRQVVEQ